MVFEVATGASIRPRQPEIEYSGFLSLQCVPHKKSSPVGRGRRQLPRDSEQDGLSPILRRQPRCCRGCKQGYNHNDVDRRGDCSPSVVVKGAFLRSAIFFLIAVSL